MFPLISYNSLVELSLNTSKLGRDIVLFTCERLHATFTSTASSRIFPTLSLFDMNIFEQSAKVLFGLFRRIGAIASMVYEDVNAQSVKMLDPVVEEFRVQYPDSGQYIGESLLDRLLLVFWLIFAVKLLIAFLTWPIRVVFAFKKIEKTKCDSGAMEERVVKDILIVKEQVSPPKPEMNKEVPKTVRKRIMIARR